MISSLFKHFAALTSNLVPKRIFPRLTASDIVNVQPMTAPSQMIFYMQFQIGGHLKHSHIVFVPSLWRRNKSAFSYNFYLRSSEKVYVTKEKDAQPVQYHAYDWYRVTTNTPCQLCKTLVPSSYTQEITPIGDEVSLEELCERIDTENAYLIPLPEAFQETRVADLVARNLGESLKQRGNAPLPSFEEMTVIVLEASGLVQRDMESGLDPNEDQL